MDRLNRISDESARYMARPAERLVLEGYRCWTQAAARDRWQPLEDIKRLYSATLDVRDIRPVVAALCDFVGTLGLCARCPLHTFEAGSLDICRDETLILGLVSGLQNGDDRAADLCLRALTCPSRCEPVAVAAGNFAFILKGMGKTLLPIPAPVIRGILERTGRHPSAPEDARRPAGATLH